MELKDIKAIIDQAVDLVRAASRGKRFWHAEAQAGPLWMQPQVTNRPREDGRTTQPEDIRLWNMVSFAGGATGILYPRWRPLLSIPRIRRGSRQDGIGPEHWHVARRSRSRCRHRSRAR